MFFLYENTTGRVGGSKKAKALHKKTPMLNRSEVPQTLLKITKGELSNEIRH